MYIIDRDPIALKIAKLRETLGDLPREKLDEIARDVRGLQHELHCATLSYTGAIEEVRKLRAERDAARADALALATERNSWQAMYNDAMAERDAARALLKRAFPYVVNANVRFSQPEKLVSDIESALPTVWDRPDAAAGALMIDVPEPGTDMAKVMLANAAMRRERDEALARVDALMQEYCPDEMTPEQRAEWAEHQQPVTPNVQAAIDAALREDKP